MAIINIMENSVDMRIKEYMKDSDCCSCEMCLEDIKCLALNKLPPKYVSSLKGELFSRVDQQMKSQNNLDIDVAVLNTIEFVKKNPRHK